MIEKFLIIYGQMISMIFLLIIFGILIFLSDYKFHYLKQLINILKPCWKAISKYVYITCALIFLGVWLRVGFVLFYPYAPINISDPIKIINKQMIHCGDYIRYEVAFDMEESQNVTVSRTLINHYIHHETPFTVFIPIGKHTLIDVMKTPVHIEPGLYHIVLDYTIRVSEFPVRDIHKIVETETFVIIK
jgi:hypothetical protein